MMKEYQKINTLFKRDMQGDKKLIVGEWATPEFEFLQNNEWEFTEKVDGTNIRVHFDRIDSQLFTWFGGRTDNADIPPALLQALNKIFLDEDVQQNVGNLMVERDIPALTMYGEGYGPKINGGGKYRETPGFVLFDVRVGDWWLQTDGVNAFSDALNIDRVPILGYGTLHEAVERCSNGGFDSTWGDFKAEGIVARPRVQLFDRKGVRVIAKIKTVDFL